MKGSKENAFYGKQKGLCSKGDACSFRHDDSKRGKKTQSSSLAPRPQTQNASKWKSPRGSCPSGRKKACRNFLQGNCKNPSCDYWHHPVCQHHRKESGCKFGEKCVLRRTEADSPAKKPKKSGGKGTVALLKNSKQLGCVFQDMEPPQSKSIVRKGSDIRKPIRCVRFTKAVVRHATIRDQNPSLGMICPGDPHQRNPNAPKFEDRSFTRRDRVARAMCPWSSVEVGQNIVQKEKGKIKPHSSHFRKIGACLHQPLNQRIENLLWTPELRCTWSAESIWIPLNWKQWRHREVRRRLEQPMVKCRPQCMSKNRKYSWHWKSSSLRQQFYRQESFATNTDTHTSGSTVKNHIFFKTVFEYCVIRKTSYQSWFLVYQRVLPQACSLQHPWHLQCRKLIIPRLPQARLLHPWHLQLCQAKVWLDKNGETRAG